MSTTVNISTPSASRNIVSEYRDEEGGLIQQEQEHESTSEKRSPLRKAAAVFGVLMLGVVAVANTHSSSSNNSDNIIGPTSTPFSNQRRDLNEKCNEVVNVDFQYTGKFAPLASCSGSPRLFEMIYHGGPCPDNTHSSCRDYNGGPPPQQDKETEVYISVTDRNTQDILYAGTRKSGGDFYVFNKWKTLPEKAAVQIYTDLSRKQLLQVASMDTSCLNPNVIYNKVGASQIMGFDTPSNGLVSVLFPRSPPNKVTLTISAAGSASTSNDQRRGSKHLKLSSLRVSNDSKGIPQQVKLSRSVGNKVLTNAIGSSLQVSFDAHFFAGQQYQTTVAGTIEDLDSGRVCDFEKTDIVMQSTSE